MNYLKKKLKPLTAGFNTAQQGASQSGGAQQRDLEDDLYDDHFVEAPPHPSELLALGVEPSEIDVNDPDKLRELYRKAKEEGKDKKTNSVLLARQRQKEEIEEKKRTREEWKFFDSLTSRVEQVVKESQKNLDHWKESSTVCNLTEPEYELRQTADEVFRPVTTVKLEKGQNDWIDFGDEGENSTKKNKQAASEQEQQQGQVLDEFGCPVAERRKSSAAKPSEFVVDELLEDFGIDLRTAEQKRALEEKQRKEAEEKRRAEAQLRREEEQRAREEASKLNIDIKAAARPRPRPKGVNAQRDDAQETKQQQVEVKPEAEIDPFQTSFISENLVAPKEKAIAASEPGPEQAKFIDPFDTSYVNLE